MTWSPSEDELPESESIMFTLPTELDTPVLSTFPIVDQSEYGKLPGESGATDALDALWSPFRGGIITPLPPITGDESGEDCSASVE